jgi:diketogulonate reductase-like aldo/keto reductase
MRRRTFIKTGIAGAAWVSVPVNSETSVTELADSKPSLSERVPSMLQRVIPSTGERITVIGLGTWQAFDAGSDKAQRAKLRKVLQLFYAGGGRVVDSSPMYGSSESVVGDLAARLGISDDLFMASKVWTHGKAEGIRQMQRSIDRMQTQQMDLMQVHNLVDAKVQLQSLARWKESNTIRYLGITHYHSGGYAGLKQLMLDYKLDFIQINYSILQRGADVELLPLAKEKGIAVLINRPYETGKLFSKVRGISLPEWASEFDCNSWGQFFLKFILSNDAVSCVIPGTSKTHHMQDNLQAGLGRLPDQKQRAAMVTLMESI